MPFSRRSVLFLLGLLCLTGCLKLTHLSSGGYVLSSVARTGAAAVVHGDRVYLIGGQTLEEHGANGSSYLRSVSSAQFQSDGSIGAWQELTPLPTPLGYASVVIHQDALYVIGGYKDNNPGTSGVVSDILRASFQADGTLSAWSPVMALGQPMGVARAGAAIVGSSLFVVGGLSSGGSSLDTIVRYPIQEDGKLSLPVTEGRLSGARNRFALVADAQGLYAVGGYKGGFSSPYDASVERILWTPESHGSASEAQPKLEVKSGMHTAHMIGNNLLVVGGFDGGQYLDRIEVGTRNSAGQITGWKVVGKLKSPRASHASVLYNNALYVLGGGNKGGMLEDYERIPLDSLSLQASISAP